MSNLRTLKATLDTSAIRTETFEGRDYIVSPVVAMIGNSVVEAVGSEGPELVPAEELAKWPGGWNNRPVTNDHPAEGSANSPTVLERQSMGNIFNAKYDNDALRMENWIDVQKTERLGGEALDTLNRVRNGEPVEVSIGASISLIPTSGELNGKPYIGRWSEIVPDHLALLPRGAIGACSIEMGCGIRTAVSQGGDKMKTTLRKFIKALANKGLSDNTLRDKISNQVASIPPSVLGFDNINAQFWGVEDVYQESSTALSIFWDGEKTRVFQHRYKLNDDESVSLIGKPEEGQFVGEPKFETFSSDNDSNVNRNDSTTVDEVADSLTPPDNKGDKPMANPCRKAEIVTALIARKAFSEDDKETLMGLEVSTLETIAGPLLKEEEKPVEEPAAPAPVVTVADEPTMVSVPADEWAEVKAASAAYHAQRANEKSKLVAQLKGKVELSDADLAAMSNEILFKLCAGIKKLETKDAEPDTTFATLGNYALAEPASIDSQPRQLRIAPRAYEKQKAQSEVN